MACVAQQLVSNLHIEVGVDNEDEYNGMCSTAAGEQPSY